MEGVSQTGRLSAGCGGLLRRTTDQIWIEIQEHFTHMLTCESSTCEQGNLNPTLNHNLETSTRNDCRIGRCKPPRHRRLPHRRTTWLGGGRRASHGAAPWLPLERIRPAKINAWLPSPQNSASFFGSADRAQHSQLSTRYLWESGSRPW